jgi:hypothetical protein
LFALFNAPFEFHAVFGLKEEDDSASTPGPEDESQGRVGIDTGGRRTKVQTRRKSMPIATHRAKGLLSFASFNSTFCISTVESLKKRGEIPGDSKNDREFQCSEVKTLYKLNNFDMDRSFWDRRG